jgi:hypothetical protein
VIFLSVRSARTMSPFAGAVVERREDNAGG